MKAKLKRLHSPDINNLSTYSPKHPENFSFLLQAMISPDNEGGEESFDIEICTPTWLYENYKKEDMIIGRHLLIVFEFNYDRIVQKIKSFIETCTGDSWEELVQKIGRLGKWEFEDYEDN